MKSREPPFFICMRISIVALTAVKTVPLERTVEMSGRDEIWVDFY
jgi:hypothetical protein